MSASAPRHFLDLTEIPVDELRYWSVARQEAYVSCAASLDAEQRAGALPNQKR